MAFVPAAENESAAFLAALTFADEYQSSSCSDYDDESDVVEPRRRAVSLNQSDEEEEEELEPLVELTAFDDIIDFSLAAECDDQQTTPPQLRVRPMQPVFSKNPLPKKHGVKLVMTWGPNKSRNERKQELIYLRNKVTELEAQLSDVKSKKKHPRSASSSSPYPIHPTHRTSQQLHLAIPRPAVSHNSAVASVWKEIAGRQFNERTRSERENIRLKLVLENQLKIAKSLQKFLKKSTVTRQIEKCVHGNKGLRHVYPPTTTARTDTEIFDDLLAGVERSYDEVDAVFAANGLARSEIPRIDAKMRSDAASGMFMEVFANKLLPFDVFTAGAAVWHHFVSAKAKTPYRSYYPSTPTTMNATEDTIVENFNLEMHENNTSALFTVKQVLRRYIEHDRVVIVWRTFFDPIEFSDEPLTVQFLEKGYIVVKRPTTIAGNFSIMQPCYITTPLLTGDATGDSNPRVGAITDFVLRATASNITASHQMIENALLEQTLRA